MAVKDEVKREADVVMAEAATGSGNDDVKMEEPVKAEGDGLDFLLPVSPA